MQQVHAQANALVHRPSAISPLKQRARPVALGRPAALRVVASDDEDMIPILGGGKKGFTPKDLEQLRHPKVGKVRAAVGRGMPARI